MAAGESGMLAAATATPKSVGLLSRLKKRSSNSAASAKLAPASVASYNQPLTPEDAIMTPSGGYVDRRWLLDGGVARCDQVLPSCDQVLPGMTTTEASGTSTAGSSKTRRFRLWRTVLKRCKKIGGGGGKGSSGSSGGAASAWPAPPPPPRCVLERVASESTEGTEDLILEDDYEAVRRKCSYHSELKTSKVQFSQLNGAACCWQIAYRVSHPIMHRGFSEKF